MDSCPPHRFVGADSFNVQCVDCGFMRHRIPIDDDTNIHEIVDSLKRQSPYYHEVTPINDMFRKWQEKVPNDYIVTIGTDTETGNNSLPISSTYKIKPTDFTWTVDYGQKPTFSLAGTVV